MKGLLRRISRQARNEEGSAAIEFLFAIPVLMTIFMASFESGYFMIRHVMLERAVDITMRELRLGLLGNVSHNDLRTLVCTRAVVLGDCDTNLKIEMQPISTANWTMPATPTTCMDRAVPIDPVTTFVRGGGSEPVLVRFCARQETMFPSTGIGLGLQKDGLGGYALLARSVFVNEPS